MKNATSNPWFWGGMSRHQFELDLVKNAVALVDEKGRVLAPRKKVDIEAIKARKNELAAKGIGTKFKRPTNAATTTTSK